MKKNIYCVIMAGGTGTRFWPLSRVSHPKQFVDMMGLGSSLFQMTYERFSKICPKENIYVVTHVQYREVVQSQVPELSEAQILCEPARRNTAPCIAYACRVIQLKDPDANIVVSPSDHYISDDSTFIETLFRGLQESEQSDHLITLGIRPSSPNTDYGYIQYEEEAMKPELRSLRRVVTFTEKPEYEMAMQFLQSGDFLWNAGIFLWNAAVIEQAFCTHLPEIHELFQSLEDPYNPSQIERIYSECPSISIDYGVLEHADNVCVLISDFGWSDVSTWTSLYDVRKKDDERNALIGKNVLLYDTKNCIINVPKNKLVVIQGLDDYIVVEEDKVLMICKKSEEHRIKKFLSDVEIEKGERYI